MSVHSPHIVYSKEARVDIRDILVYTAREWGDDQRRIYRRMIEDAIENLRIFPESGVVRDFYSPGLRCVFVERHAIYYWLRSGSILIARVLHKRQDVFSIDWQASRRG
jgi:toxin ParE1/3/4